MDEGKISVEERSRSFDDLLVQDENRQFVRHDKNTIVCSPGKNISYVIRVDRRHRDRRAIFLSLREAIIRSEWFSSLLRQTQIGYFRLAQTFCEWLALTKSPYPKKNNYKYLKDFESYLLDEEGMKYSNLSILNFMLKEGLTSEELTAEEAQYVAQLVKLSTPRKIDHTPHQKTLSDWFSSPWLRRVIGEEMYLSLESSKKIALSFRITVSVTLQFILKARQQRLDESTLTFSKVSKEWFYEWAPRLFAHAAKFDSKGCPANELTKLMFVDMVKPQFHEYLIEKIKSNDDVIKFSPNDNIDGRSGNIWLKPLLFDPGFQETYTYLEQMLMAWLCACETIQPADIAKLKSSDYAREYSNSGRLIAAQCQYYKGRSGRRKEPAILVASQPWARALNSYLDGLSGTHKLFNIEFTQKKYTMITQYGEGYKNRILRLLIRIWAQPSIRKIIDQEHLKNGSTNIFIRAFFALIENGYSFSDYRADKGMRMSVEDYYESDQNTFAVSLFSLAHIKNTAVHAASDSYRESDPINYNSHTSTTEKLNYLTDSNRDFINRAGRITRLVLNDMKAAAFNPSVDSISSSITTLDVKTRLKSETDDEYSNIRPLHKSISTEDYGDEILVIDSKENALLIIHYLTEFERVYKELCSRRPKLVEEKLIVQIEWLSGLIGKMKSAATAKKLYRKIYKSLPPMFDHLLESLE